MSIYSNVPHYKVRSFTIIFILYGSPFANRTLMGLLALRVGKPQHIMSFGLRKKCVASLSTHETFLSFIWTSRYEIVCFGLSLLALVIKPPSNIQFTTLTLFVLVLQCHLLTLCPWHKHEFSWYHNTTFSIPCAVQTWIAWYHNATF